MKKTYALDSTKYLNDEEKSRLETSIEFFLNQDESLRDALIILLSLKLGSRAQELLNVTKKDINVFYKTVYIKGLKGSNNREIPLPSKLFAKLQKYIESFKDEDKIFPISYDRLYQIWLKYRTCPKTFHALRHTFAINLYKKTKDLRLVQVALGHRSITNTMIYSEYVYSHEELKKLIL